MSTMADIGINFLQQFRKKVTKQQALDLKIFRYTAGVVGVIAVVTLLVTGASFWLQLRSGQNQDQLKELQRSILLQEEVEKSVVILTRKLGVLSQLLEERQDKQAAISFFTDLFGPEVLLEEIDYAADESILSLRIKVPSIFEVSDIYAVLSAPPTAERYGTVKTSDLRRDKDGKYGFTMTIVLAESRAK